MSYVITYFGCWGDKGHHHWWPSKQHCESYGRLPDRWPKGNQLDAACFLGDEVAGKAWVTYLPGIDATVLAWWGSPWDKRGNVNQAVIAQGDNDFEKMWKLFCAWFPELSANFTKPELAP